MKIAIVGSRKFSDKELVKSTVTRIIEKNDVIVSGGAKGVDSWAEEIMDILNSGLQDFNISKLIFFPEYDKYGRKACAIRNQQIVDASDKVLAFWDGKSPGTKMTIGMAMKANKPLDIYIRS